MTTDDSDEEVETIDTVIFYSDTEVDLTKISRIKVVRELGEYLQKEYRVQYLKNKCIQVNFQPNEIEAIKRINSISGHQVNTRFPPTPHTPADLTNSSSSLNTPQDKTRTISWGKIISHNLFYCTDDEKSRTATT